MSKYIPSQQTGRVSFGKNCGNISSFHRRNRAVSRISRGLRADELCIFFCELFIEKIWKIYKIEGLLGRHKYWVKFVWQPLVLTPSSWPDFIKLRGIVSEMKCALLSGTSIPLSLQFRCLMSSQNPQRFICGFIIRILSEYFHLMIFGVEQS